ncbi:MAG: glycosyltransferase family 39 protein [Ignavibacteriae bacterium]|nr:glycosyltransferase family 39 protein [Ignavibacteriota bacterium]
MMTGLHPRRISRPALALLLPATVQLLIHLFFATGYGLGGDELYAIACSNTPAAGYVDLAPAPVLLLALQRTIGGDALIAIRFVPAVIAAVAVYFTGLIARRMGAGAYGQFLAALCALIAPALLVAGHVATPFGFAVLWWTIGTYVVVRLLQENTRLWVDPARPRERGRAPLQLQHGILRRGGIPCGRPYAAPQAASHDLALGRCRHCGGDDDPVGALAVGACVADHRVDERGLRPPCIGNAHPGCPHRSGEAPSSADHRGLAARPRRTLLRPALPSMESHRLDVHCHAILMIAVAMEPHYLVPAAAGLFAAGAVLVEKVLARSWMRVTTVVVLVLAGVATLPMGLPVLPARTFIDYEKMSGFRMTMGNAECTDRLPGYYGTMFGRKELATVMNAVFTTMPPEERGRYGIFCETAVQAASLDFYGKDYNLPAAVSGDRQYWYRGPGGYTGDRLVVVGVNEEDLRTLFGEVHLRMRFRDEYLHPGNGMTPVWLVGRPAQPLEKAWTQLWTIR